jgi:hypothetical protein
MNKTAALKSSNTLVMRSAATEKLPATPKPPKFKDFNRFVETVDELHEYRRELDRLRFGSDHDASRCSGDVEDDDDYCRELVEKCKAGFLRFDRADNYDQDGDLRRDHVAKRISVMVASFPNVNPGNPEGYMRMLIEHVAASEGLTDVALESACREIVETKKFAPAISEVMDTIRDHFLKWQDRKRAVLAVEDIRRLTIEVFKKGEEDKQKEAHEREVQVARYSVQSAMRMTQQLAKEIETKKAELATLMQRHAAAEQRESKLMRELRTLTTPPEEAEAAAVAAKANGSGARLV